MAVAGLGWCSREGRGGGTTGAPRARTPWVDAIIESLAQRQGAFPRVGKGHRGEVADDDAHPLVTPLKTKQPCPGMSTRFYPHPELQAEDSGVGMVADRKPGERIGHEAGLPGNSGLLFRDTLSHVAGGNCGQGVANLAEML